MLAAAASAYVAVPAMAQAPGTQFIGITGYRVGPYGANGAAFFSGFIDYLTLVNERDGGVNGVLSVSRRPGDESFDDLDRDLITAVAGVREAAVCAVRRGTGVTSLRAYVVVEPGVHSKGELAEAIRSSAEASLTWYKVPEDVEFVDALPRNGTGKILRRTLRGWNTEVPDDAR